MEEKLISRRDLAFQLYEVLKVESLTQRPRYQEHDRSTFEAILDTAQQIAQTHFAPFNRKADENEPVFEAGQVRTIPETKVAVKAHADAGFLVAHHDVALGGMQLPAVVINAAMALFKAANVSFAAYPLLTLAAGNLIHRYGSEEQKKRFLPLLLDGRATGTMCLTEPHAGSSLGDLRTRAEPQPDGTYRLFGNKIFISGGDHDFGGNIIHLVLARISGAPAGVKGISLFIVPKFLVDEEGRPGERNDVVLAGLLHKMGYRGTTSTVLTFGERDGAVGYLVGEPHQGLKYMFHMMNEARIGVGMGAIALGYTGYLHALDYARNRPQGRPLANKDPSVPQVPIIEHPDVRRMLLAQKAYVEGCLALGLYAARLVDDIRTGDEAERARAQELLDLLTPIVKAGSSQFCLKANELAIQVFGGAGYTRDYPVEQFYRDNRLNPIHEGTDGIQSLDLLGRKLWQNGSAGVKLLFEEVDATLQQAASENELAEMAAAVQEARDELAALITRLGQRISGPHAERVLANSFPFLEVFSRFVLAWQWLRQALVAIAGSRRADLTEADANFYRGKLHAARYFLRWELPQIKPLCRLLEQSDPSFLEMKNEWF